MESCQSAVSYFYNQCSFKIIKFLCSLDRSQNISWRSWNIFRHAQHCSSRCDVCKNFKFSPKITDVLLLNRYTYYMLAAIGPHMQKYLWWKKYLTSMQMVQFIVVFLHAMQLFLYNPCGFPIVYVYIIIGHAAMFFFLFKGLDFETVNHLIIYFLLLCQAFYVKSYVSKKTDMNKNQSMLNGICFPSISDEFGQSSRKIK
jgi:GNS1/SUR4 family